jgi:Ca2+-binding RTX toxin-like protein
MQGLRPPRRRLLVEPLEDRSLPAAAVSSILRSGVLSVTGSETADIIVVRQTGAGAVMLDANGIRQNFRDVSRIVVDGRGGDDRIYMDTRVTDAARIAAVPVQFQGGAGNDLLVGGSGSDQLSGGDGSDTIYGDRGSDWIDGGSGADRLYGNDGDDVLMGGAGDDLLVGGAGTDYLDAGIGNDWLYGGDGADTLLGGAGSDFFDGGAGNDKLYGGDGNDWLTGGAGDDMVSGAAGNDYLDGGPGTDTLLGGDGFDTYFKDFGDDLTGDQSEATDIHQGSSGTCVVLASLAAVADSGVDLSARIVKTGENQYSVPLFRPGAGWVWQTVYFDGLWTDNDPMLTNAGDAWVLIYQRAFLQEMGVRWNDPDQSAWASRYGDQYQRADAALLAITGAAAWHAAPADGLTVSDLTDLAVAVGANHPTIVLSRAGGMSGFGLIDDHAYTVLSVQRDASGAITVTLRNPWGADGPIRQGADDGVITLSWDAFRVTMLGFCVA